MAGSSTSGTRLPRSSFARLGEVLGKLWRQRRRYRCFFKTIQERPIGNVLPRLVDRSGLSKTLIVHPLLFRAERRSSTLFSLPLLSMHEAAAARPPVVDRLRLEIAIGQTKLAEGRLALPKARISPNRKSEAERRSELIRSVMKRWAPPLK